MKLFFNILIISCLFTACKQEKERTFTVNDLSEIAYDTTMYLPEHYRKRVEGFSKTAMKNCNYLFLGNSITEGGDWSKLLNDSTIVNQGIGGDVTFGVLRRLEHVAFQKPKLIFMMIGVNDLRKKVPDSVIQANTLKIVSEIKQLLPDTKIFVQSVLPIHTDVADFPDDFDYSENILRVNAFLKDNESSHYTYVDLHSEFIDSKGQMDLLYTTDGLHLNELGYNHWIKILRSYHDFGSDKI